MNRFLALGAHKELSAIKEQLTMSDVDIMFSRFSDLEVFISKDDVKMNMRGEDLLAFDYVWLTSSWVSRQVAYTVSLFLQNSGMRYSPVEEEKSKLVDMLMFGLEGISLPDTYFTMTRNLKHKLKSIVEFCGYPFIVKPTRGSLGKNIYLIRSESDFNDFIERLNPKQQYLCQRYIPNNFDYRIIIAGGEVVSAVKRIRKTDSFRNNTYLGAEEVFMNIQEIPANILKIALDSTSSLGLNWSGVDIVVSTETGEGYILELNRRPGLTAGSTEISAAYNHIISLAQAS